MYTSGTTRVHELAEAYAKIDKGKPYSDTVVTVNGMVLARIVDPGAHNSAGAKEDTWRQQNPHIQSTGRAADQLNRDPQAHPSRPK